MGTLARWTVIAFFAASCPALVFAQESIDEIGRGLAAEDPARRGAAMKEGLSRWAEWSDDDLAKVERTAPDAEAAALAARLRQGTLLRRRLGPRLAGIIETEGGAATEEPGGGFDMLESAMPLWTSGAVSPREYAEFMNVLAENGWGKPGARSCELLGDTGPPGYAAHLAELLDDAATSDANRLGILIALGNLNVASEAARIAAQLGHRYPPVRAQAAWVLARIGGSRYREELRSLLRDRDASVRRGALGALKALEMQPPENELVVLLEDPSSEVRGFTVDLLASNESRAVVEALERALGDSDAMVRGKALLALTRQGRRDLGPQAIRALRAENAAGIPTIAEAIRTLGTRECIDSLFEIVEKGDEMAPVAADILATLEVRESIPRLAALLAAKRPAARAAAIRILASLGGREHLGAIALRLRDDVPHVRIEAVRALEYRGARDQVPRLAQAATSDDPSTRCAAIQALGTLGASEHAAIVATNLASPETVLRLAALRALREMDATEFADAVAKLFASNDQETRGAAALTLSVLGGPRHADSFLPLLKEPGGAPCVWAAVALLRLGRADDVEHWLNAPGAERHNLADELVAEFLRNPHTAPLFLGLWDEDRCTLSPWDLVRLPFPGPVPLRPADQKEMIRRLTNLEAHGGRTGLAASIVLIRAAGKTRADQSAILRLAAEQLGRPRNPMLSQTLCALASANEPAAWRKLVEPQALQKEVKNEKDLRDLIEKTGLAFDAGDLVVRGRSAPGRQVTIRDILERSLAYTDLVLVLEGARLRILRDEEALEYWLKRLAE